MTNGRALLGEVATFIRGINFKPEDVVPVGTPGSVACMRTKNVQQVLDMSDVWAVAESLVRRDDQILRRGDILVSSANSWNLVGKCSWIPDLPWRASFGGFVSTLRSDPTKIEPRYLFWWFSSDRVQATLRSFGQQTTNISNLNIDRCLRMEIPLPSRTEQRRIAAVLDAAEALRAKRRAAIDKAARLTSSVFVEMFGHPTLSPKYRRTSVRPFVEASSGKSSKEVLSAIRTKYPIFGGNGVNGWATRPLYDEPVVIFGRVGQQCGNTFLSDRPCWVTDNAIVVRIADSSAMDATYLMHAFRMTGFSESVKHLDLPFINQQMILDYKLALPPIERQAEFARRVGSFATVRQRYDESYRRFNDLFASLQHRSFQGGL